MQGMITGSLLVEAAGSKKVDEKQATEGPVKKRKRKNRKNKSGDILNRDRDESASNTDGYEADSHMEGGSSDEEGQG